MASKIRCHWLLVAEKVELKDDKLNICNVLEMLILNRTGVSEMPLFVFSHWTGGPRGRKESYEVRLVKPDGTFQSEYPEMLFGPVGTARPTAVIGGAEFPEYGDYYVEIFYGGEIHVRELLAVVPRV